MRFSQNLDAAADSYARMLEEALRAKAAASMLADASEQRASEQVPEQASEQAPERLPAQAPEQQASEPDQAVDATQARRSMAIRTHTDEMQELSAVEMRLSIVADVLAAADRVSLRGEPLTLGSYGAGALKRPTGVEHAVAVAEAAARALGSGRASRGVSECWDNRDTGRDASYRKDSEVSDAGETHARLTVRSQGDAPRSTPRPTQSTGPARQKSIRFQSRSTISSGLTLLPPKDDLSRRSKLRSTQMSSLRKSELDEDLPPSTQEDLSEMDSSAAPLESPRRLGQLEETEISIFNVLTEVADPQARGKLLQRLRELVSELAVVRSRVKALSAENSSLQKKLAEQRRLESQIRDLEMQNQMFSARQLEGETSLKEREAQAVLEARQVWERGRMSSEDAAVERQLIAQKTTEAQEAENRTSLADDVTRAEKLLGPLRSRQADLEKIRDEAQRLRAENPALLQKVCTRRKGKPRWN